MAIWFSFFLHPSFFLDMKQVTHKAVSHHLNLILYEDESFWATFSLHTNQK